MVLGIKEVGRGEKRLNNFLKSPFSICPVSMEPYQTVLTCVHGEDFVVAEHLGDELLELSEHVIVEGARGKGEHACLVHERFDNTGVAVALVDRRVGAEEVIVAVTLHVPHEHTLKVG